MSRLLVPALALTALGTLGAGAMPPRRTLVAAPGASLDGAAASFATSPATGLSLCPAGTLPDGDACVHLPQAGQPADVGAPETAAHENAHYDKQGHYVVYDQIPRRPERPANYDAYVYPIPPGMPGGHYVISGYDLDLPDRSQRRGARLSHVGHGGVDLPQRKGLPIYLLNLEHQQGEAEVIFVGSLFGTTVMTRHTLKEGGQLRDYLLLFGHLDAPAPAINVGQKLKEGELVGFVGDTSSPELVHLHLEARRFREENMDLHKMTGAQMITNEVSIVCDPRNVLPLKNP
jgi:murein DD-endopeptidase MepM/ murein hydrolase activator NlpD